MPEWLYDLKLADRRVVTWPGADAEDAARRYVDSERVAGRAVSVIATRAHQQHGIFVLGNGVIIG